MRLWSLKSGTTIRSHLRVADTGVGIPGEAIDRVFEPFVQLDSGLTRRAEGAGLGLAISRRLARLMGGDLTLESKLGKGSIAYADGMLVCRDEGGKGTIALIEATPSGWNEKGRFDQPDRSRAPSWAQPVIADGKLFIRDQDVLLCYEVKASK